MKLGFGRNANPITFWLRLGVPLLPTSSGFERMNSGYVSISGQVHRDIRLDF
jgi:hypothetical protein